MICVLLIQRFNKIDRMFDKRVKPRYFSLHVLKRKDDCVALPGGCIKNHEN